MRTIRTLLSATALSLSVFGVQASTEFLDFNDNTVPGGWTLVPTSAGTNWGVAAGRLYAGGIDSAGLLQKGLSGLTSNSIVSVQWDGNLTRTFWGNFSGIRLAFTSLDDLTNEYRTQIGAAQASYPLNSVVIGVGNDATSQMHDLPDGIYNYRAVFSQGSISFSGSLAGSEMFSWNYTNPSIDMSQVLGIRLHVYETVGPDIWMDNVSISVSTVPESGSVLLFMAGWLVIVGWRKHRGGDFR